MYGAPSRNFCTKGEVVSPRVEKKLPQERLQKKWEEKMGRSIKQLPIAEGKR